MGILELETFEADVPLSIRDEILVQLCHGIQEQYS